MEESVVAHGTLNVNAALVCAHRRHMRDHQGWIWDADRKRCPARSLLFLLCCVSLLRDVLCTWRG